MRRTNVNLPLSFWEEEPDEDDRADHERSEQEEETVAHRSEGLWGESGDNEVPEPVGSGGSSLTKSTDVLTVHLGVVNPWGSVP